MGRNRRQQRLRERRQQDGGAQPSTGAADGRRLPAKPKAAWRQAVDSWGGFPVIGSIAIAVIAVGLLIWFNRPGATAGGGDYVPVARAMVDGRVEGDPSAPVRIIEFSDFQCPFCKRFTDETAPLIYQEYVATGIASVEYRHFAFLGEDSFRAAEAAECALDQGRFWDMHDLLYLRQGRQNSGVYSAANLKGYAREIAEHFPDFDVRAFDSCLDSGEKRTIVNQMNQQASQLGIGSTPSFFINGVPVPGAQPIDVFRNLIDAAHRDAGS